jgi:hypothetical protein
MKRGDIALVRHHVMTVARIKLEMVNLQQLSGSRLLVSNRQQLIVLQVAPSHVKTNED